jgi:hypothetical protein
MFLINKLTSSAYPLNIKETQTAKIFHLKTILRLEDQSLLLFKLNALPLSTLDPLPAT